MRETVGGGFGADGDRIRVVAESLRGASLRLSGVASDTEEMLNHTALRSFDQGAAGDRAVAGAIESLVDRWRFGLHGLHGDLVVLCEALTRAAHSYDRLEAAIARAAR